MKAKDYFMNIRRLNASVKAKAEKIEQIRSQITSIGCIDYSKDIVEGGANQDSIGECIAKLVDLENELSKQIKELCELQAEAIQRIDAMPYADYRLILTLRFVNGYTWERCAVDMGFSYQWVQELCKRALVQFDELYFQ